MMLTYILWIHIALGTLALIAGPGAMLTQKGGVWHRRWGRLFFWGMLGVAATTVPLALYPVNLFLLLIGVFSFYLAFTGVRVLAMKRPEDRPTWWDWGVTVVTLISCLFLAGIGLGQLASGDAFGSVALSLGSLGVGMAAMDVQRYRSPPTEQRAWFFLHLSRMLGAYIAAVSAVSAVNLMMLPPAIRWLWPTVIGVVGIVWWSRYYRRRFAGDNASSTAHV